MKKVSKIEPVSAPTSSLKKVAAYARVSMESARLEHSLAAQISFYSDLIQKTPGWVYAGVYADNGISGTGTASREDFNRLLDDCEAGKIDIILTKSISRFARNTVDLLNTVRRLKELGISVRFEKENIDSLSEDGELMLTLLASFAQEESRSISENVKWATVKRFQQGIPNGKFSIYGYRWEGDQLVIQPEEAEVVRYIFREYMTGKSRIEIGRQLMAMGIYSKEGKEWVDSNVKCILTNIHYTGNLLFQKEYTLDPISKKTRKNRGELPQYFVEDTHEAIIPMEEFQAVQAEFKRRRELGALGNKSLNLTAFSTKITCGICGKHYRRSGHRTSAKDILYTWTCLTKNYYGKKVCDSKNIPEKVLQSVSAEVLGLETFDEDIFKEQIKEILVTGPDSLEFRFFDGRTESRTWVSTAKYDWWTPERRAEWGERHKRKDSNPNKKTYHEFTGFIRCGRCGENYRSQLINRKDGTSTRNWYCTSPRSECRNTPINDDVLRGLVSEVLGLTEFDETAMDEKIEYASIIDWTVTFHFRDGHTEERTYEKPKRHGTPWTEERRIKTCQSISRSWTDERKAKMSKRIKEIRSERKWPEK